MEIVTEKKRQRCPIRQGADPDSSLLSVQP